ncbi:RNA polymerase-associated protein RapA [Granulosicoccus antarcticus IMCC3135]|uniref:RNA polymerase-associated protein RapA n=2 Tax=Granulosicoccus TaxID=437504 RepID=A0A2Z2NQY8_9GAMM|nr:RNA polymerase-associated protein RapA [Granulosicoccus antarcticus IMCC3135]
MQVSLGLTPSGKLHVFFVDKLIKDESSLQKVARYFDGYNDGRGLFELASSNTRIPLDSTFQYWRDFAEQYMKSRCLESDEATLLPLDLLDAASLDSWLINAPPMPGAEYLSATVLQGLWKALDVWLLDEVTENHPDFNDFLEKRAPGWHQMGRVCFHLAENKNDRDYPFAFMATYVPEYGRGKARHLPLAKALEDYAGHKNRKQLLSLLSPVDLAAKSSELVNELVVSGDIYHPLAWSAQDAYQFLRAVPLLQESGVIIRLPDWWKKRVRPQVQVTLSTKTKNALSADRLLDFDVRPVIGDLELTDAEWQSLLASADGLVFIRGQWVEVDQEKLVEAMGQMEALEKHADVDGISFFEGMRLLAGASKDLSAERDGSALTKNWVTINADAKLAELLRQIRQPETLKPVLPGRALKAELRHYQQTGVRWLWQLNQLGLGACLADDMGLGKTIQVISLLLILKKRKVAGPSLLVLPTSLLGNWEKELAGFAPSLKSMFVHPSMIDKTDMQTLSAEKVEESDLVVTSYGMLLRQPWLYDVSWNTVVLDEAQAIKNPGSQQTKAAKKLRARVRIALTGTPVENRLSDLWSIFDFICPGLLGSFTQFKSFAKSLESRESEQFAPLRKLVQPYILRRLKTDKSIIADLPDKTEVYAYCGLSKVQLALYQQAVNQLKVSLQNEDGIKRRGLILSYILRFKQICNHPGQYIGDGDYSAKNSGKFLRLAEICEEIGSRQEKLLVFTQFREMCDPLAEFLEKSFGKPGLVLHGGVAAKSRQKMVESFQREAGPPFFVLSIKAGGTGLNLTAASHVIHFDRWWNPAVENQATDRAFRIGQKSNVLVHKFVCRGTIEEKIDAIIAEKSALADDLLEGGANVLLTEMNDKQLLDLVSLDINKLRA